MSKAFKQHPLSAAFPSLGEPEFALLCEDIRLNGLQEKIVLYNDQVIDGWHRYRACKEVRVPPEFKVYRGKSPAAFALSHNLQRRHLNAGQRAMSIMHVADWGSDRKPADDDSEAPTAAQMAEAAGVGTRTVEYARKVKANGSKTLIDAVQAGDISVARGAAIAELPKNAQRTAVAAEGSEESEYREDAKPKPTEEPVAWKVHQRALDQIVELRDSIEVLALKVETSEALLSSDAAKEMLKLRGDLASCQRRRDILTTENGELKKTLVMWRTKAQRLEKATGKK